MQKQRFSETQNKNISVVEIILTGSPFLLGKFPVHLFKQVDSWTTVYNAIYSPSHVDNFSNLILFSLGIKTQLKSSSILVFRL